MNRLWVLNSSPIIALSEGSLIWIVPKLSDQIIVPLAVAYELSQSSEQDLARQWLEKEGRSYVREIGNVDPLVTSWKLGPGETEVITWANRNPSYEAIIDDRAARRCAASLGVRVRGTIGVILLAKKDGLIPALRPVLDQMKDSGMRMSDSLINKALRLAGEE